MTREELTKISDWLGEHIFAFVDKETGYLNVSGIQYELKEAFGNEIISLPSNLDEAAEEYESSKDLHWFEQQSPFELTRNAFKSGAEWMAEQGEIVEGYIAETNEVAAILAIPRKEYNKGDKVVVQIRK